MPLHSLTNGTQLHSRRNEQPPYRRGSKITSSERLADDHYTSSDNDLRLGRLDSNSDCLRENATVKRPSLMSPYEGREPTIKAKEPEVRSAGGADGLVGGGNRFCKGKPHLWRPPTPHRRTAAAPKRTGRSSLPSSPQERERDRPRTRVPPSRRTTCCATPRYSRRRKEDLDIAGPRTARPVPMR